MDSREKFIETMAFNKKTSPNKWEFGFWGQTIENWYQQGLPKKNYPHIPVSIVNTTASLYTPTITHEWQKKKNLFEKIYQQQDRPVQLPAGIAVLSGGAPWPNHGYSCDMDVMDYFNMDHGQVNINAEQLIYPNFKPELVEETDRTITYKDIDGCTRIYSKIQQVLPAGIDWLIKGWDDWNKLKQERFSLDDIKKRLPENWEELVQEYNKRTYPLILGGYPNGVFGALAHLIGYENLFIFYYDEPALVKDIIERITDIWLSLWEEIISFVDIDACHLWEDISFGKGSMISPSVFKEFLAPYYKKITKFLKSKGIKIILVDTDGDCNELIPLFIESGITGLYPMEVSAGMDVVKVRKQYPQLQILGGIPKSSITYGKKVIDSFLEPVEWLLKQGGYVPFGDHYIPPEVPWAEFKYYREKLNSLIDEKRK
ncbi:MAG: hypothetical protein JW997_02620 [Actinobacteria bacterium]|nr:hypothetical protein [Actinomycetota bacterium]